MLIGVLGGLGSGKTLTLTWLMAMAKYFNQNVISNYKTKLGGLIESTQDYETFRDGFMSLDEIWLWADSRMSMKEKNRIINNVPLKSRKRHLTIGWTSQQYGQVDLRIRNISDILLYPKLINIMTNGAQAYDEKGRPLKWCSVKVQFPGKKHTRVMGFLANNIYDLYDTDEEVKNLIEDGDNQSLKSFGAE